MTKKIQLPALLDNPELKKLTHVEIEVNTGKISMIFTDKKMANDEYHKMRSSGIFAGQWIKSIQHWESDENTFHIP